MTGLKRPGRSLELFNSSRTEPVNFRIQNEASSNSAKIYIYDEISWWGISAQLVADAVDALDKDVKTLEVHINSPGGDMYDGLAIYNTFKNFDGAVDVTVDGIAASAASFIAQAGDIISMAQGSIMMIHDAMAMSYGYASDMRETADLLDKFSDNISTIYAARAGGDPKDWRKMMLAETWMTDQETVDNGLADKVLKTVQAPEDVENKFQLSVFNFAGRSKAPAPMKVKELQVSGPTNSSTGKSEEGKQSDITLPVFNIGGANMTDYQEVQNFIDRTIAENATLKAENEVIKTAENETKKAARLAWVDNLAKDGKIMQTQVDDIKAYVGDKSDEDFAAYRKIYDNAPKQQMLAAHGAANGTDNPTVTNTGDNPVNADEVRYNAVKGIVDRLRLAGQMSEKQIEASVSYKELVVLAGKLNKSV